MLTVIILFMPAIKAASIVSKGDDSLFLFITLVPVISVPCSIVSFLLQLVQCLFLERETSKLNENLVENVFVLQFRVFHRIIIFFVFSTAGRRITIWLFRKKDFFNFACLQRNLICSLKVGNKGANENMVRVTQTACDIMDMYAIPKEKRPIVHLIFWNNARDDRLLLIQIFLN